MEQVKLAVHAVALGVASVCFAYNAAAFVKRRESHLAINAAFYFIAVAWEKRNVEHHARALRGEK